jgi:hypothetical protein
VYFQIKEIVLWPRNPEFAARRVPFALGKVTVISGASRTGKSAVIPIIDYCLGSTTCSIPVNTIRDACEWFGVVVKTSQGEKLFARREPGAQRSTDEMFIAEAEVITEVPARVTKNTNATDVKRLLDELAGLTNLDFGAGDLQGGFDSRPSFRDLSAFVFQPQNVVANPEVLFFKTDRYEHREKLRKIFPYVLGAITPALLAKQHELKRLQADLKRKERELREIEQVSQQWLAELRAKVSEARELGLLPSASPGELTRDQMLGLLEEIVLRTDATLAVTASTISDAVRELNGLDTEESRVSMELTRLRRRLTEMSRIRDSAAHYHEALRIQRDRLQLSDWLGRHSDGGEQCPICGGGMEPSAVKLREMQAALSAIEKEAGDGVEEIPAAFDREMERVRADVDSTAEKWKAIQLRKKALSQRSNEANRQQYQAKRVERFIGNLENALQLHRRLGDDGQLRTEVEKLSEQVKRLNEELRAQNVDDRKRRALQLVNNNAARMMPLLDAERPKDPVLLQIEDLTVKVVGPGRDDYLSEIGSGSNWLSYHLAISLALQQFFLTLKHSPVPGFLVFDQPSQVYFPTRRATRSDDEEDPHLGENDIAAVRKAFAVMGAAVGEADGRLQIIVLDHAARDVWGELGNVVEFEEWRGGKKLVPTVWVPTT